MSFVPLREACCLGAHFGAVTDKVSRCGTRVFARRVFLFGTSTTLIFDFVVLYCSPHTSESHFSVLIYSELVSITETTLYDARFWVVLIMEQLIARHIASVHRNKR